MSSLPPTPDELQALRRCVRDLVALSTLPATYDHADPLGIARGLAEVLLRLLSVEFVYVRVRDREGRSSEEAARTGDSTQSPERAREIGLALAPWLLPEGADTSPAVPNPAGEGTVRLAVFPIGHGRDFGLLAAGCGRADFPTDTERLLLGVAVNQAAGLLQRKEAEDDLRRQTECLRVTLASIGDAVITTDTAGRVTSVNPVAAALTGWPEGEARGRPLAEVFRVVTEQTRREVESPAARALREGPVMGLANNPVLIARDGTERAIDDSAAPIRDGRGNVLGVVLIFRDVSERRRAERALTESEARKAAILKTAPDCVITCDEGGRVLEFNPAAERTFGYAAADVIGHDLADLIIPPGLRPRRRGGMARVLATGEGRILNRRVEMTARRADGTEFPVELTITLIPSDPPQFTAHVRDITARKTQERRRGARLAVTQVLAQSATFAEAAPGILRAVGESLGWDVGAFWVLDRPAAALRCQELWHAAAIDAQAFVDCCRGRTFGRGVGLPGRVWATGRPAWVPDVTTDDNFPRAPIAAEEGLHGAFAAPVLSGPELLGVLEFFSRDIREPDPDLLEMMATIGSQVGHFIDRRRAEDALREANRRKDEFLAMLAHELRNPLAPISNALHIIRGNGPPVPELVWARDVIDRQLRQMTRLVDDLLDVSRVSRGKIELRKERVELSAVVSSALEASRPLIDKRGQELTVALPPEPVYLDADPMRLAQVLLNLLNNAAKYTEPGGRIALRAGLGGGHITVRVTDTGAGIPPEMLSHIFEMFTQVDRTLDRSQGGLGIGLTLVRTLVEMHGGTVEAHSEGPGRGSEFVLRLPQLKDEGQRAKDEGEASVGPSSLVLHPSRRILVVDDNRDAAESLSVLLRLLGNEVRTAHDGVEAVASATEFRPDVVLLDIGLPKLNGYEAARRIREQQGDAVVLIALTGWGQDEDRRRSSEAGFNHHMTKPVEFEELQRLLTELKPASPERRP